MVNSATRVNSRPPLSLTILQTLLISIVAGRMIGMAALAGLVNRYPFTRATTPPRHLVAAFRHPPTITLHTTAAPWKPTLHPHTVRMSEATELILPHTATPPPVCTASALLPLIDSTCLFLMLLSVCSLPQVKKINYRTLSLFNMELVQSFCNQGNLLSCIRY